VSHECRALCAKGGMEEWGLRAACAMSARCLGSRHTEKDVAQRSEGGGDDDLGLGHATDDEGFHVSVSPKKRCHCV
jgi:hypothetical protein